ncbi:MAG: hypothetical protein AAF564_12000 [Bacteroidota bacterium]
MAREVKNTGADGEKLRVACTNCNRETNHLIVKSVEMTGSEPMGGDYTYDWTEGYQIVQSQGCDGFSFRKYSTNSEDMIGDVDDWRYVVYEELFPNREEDRTPMSHVGYLSVELQRIYSETIKAVKNSQYILAGVGIRAIIELIAIEKKLKVRIFFRR